MMGQKNYFTNSGLVLGRKYDIETSKRMDDPLFLEGYGYKVYSQNDEDGIIQEIFNRIGTTNKTFIEFGVQNGFECNSHYLLFKGWNGLWIEGSRKYVKQIHNAFRSVMAENPFSSYPRGGGVWMGSLK